MRKMIKSYSIIVITALLIAGCGTEKSNLSTVSAFLSEAEPSNSATSEKPTSTAPTTLSTPIPVTSLSPTAKPSTYIAPEVSSTPSEEPKTLSTPLPTPVPSITATPSPVPSNPTVVITNNININQPVNVNATNNTNSTTTPTPTSTPAPIISNSTVPTAITTPLPTPIPTAIPTPLPNPTIKTNVIVSTFAGSTYGYVDGQSNNAKFSYPTGIAVDNSGNVFVADSRNNVIRKITPDGVSTIAGNGVSGADDGQGINAKFSYPTGITLDSFGNIFVSDFSYNKIRKITPTGMVSTFAGSIKGYANGTGTNSQFYSLLGIASDNSDNLFVIDFQRIRKITPNALVSTFAGNGTQGYVDDVKPYAQFYSPNGIAVDNSGNIYIADTGNNRIRKITPDGVSTFAGSGVAGFADGISTNAKFNQPKGIAIDKSGNIFVADTNNNMIRKITPNGLVSTLAGSGFSGDSDGEANNAEFYSPNGIAVDNSGNLFVADTNNNKIRKITIK